MSYDRMQYLKEAFTVKSLKEHLNKMPDDAVIVRTYPTECPFVFINKKITIMDGYFDGPYVSNESMGPTSKKIKMVVLGS